MNPPWTGSETRITAVRTFLTAPQGTTLVVVRVETSDPGLYGLGCATFTQRARAVATAVDDYLAPQIIGRDPADITDIFTAGHLSSYWRSGPILNNALSGIDMALWDIKGKQAGMPVWQLLGGRCRTAVPVYAHAGGRDIVETADKVRACIDAGYRYVRAQVSIPGADTYGIPPVRTTTSQPDHRRWDPAGYLRIVPNLFDHLRSEIGDSVELLHDVHERLAPMDAVRLAKQLEPYHLYFLEDPLAPEDLEWLRILRAQTSTPIAIGELFTNPAEYVPLIRDRLCDFVRIHLSAIGGITPSWRLANTCELFGVRTAWHGPGDVSPIGHAANLALDAIAPNFGIQEQHVFNDAAHEVFPGCPEITDGHMWPSDGPGLGIDFDERTAALHPPAKPLVNDSWTHVRRFDGTLQRP